jgi:anti-sigma B factor antagonist
MSTTAQISSAPPRLAVEVRRAGPVTDIAVAGDIDVATVPHLRDALNDAVHRGDLVVTVDLTGCSFVDSFGLSALLNAARRLTRRDATLRVVCSEAAWRSIARARLESTLGAVR